MLDQFIEYALRYGLFGGLFVWQWFENNRRHKEREQEYRQTIKENHEVISNAQKIITEQAKSFAQLANEVKEIKCILKKGR